VETNPVKAAVKKPEVKTPKADRMTPEEEEVLKCAVRFIESDSAQSDLRDLEGSNSPSMPVDFVTLAEAVENLPETVRERYSRE
jgi:hypothetical protein